MVVVTPALYLSIFQASLDLEYDVAQFQCCQPLESYFSSSLSLFYLFIYSTKNKTDYIPHVKYKIPSVTSSILSDMSRVDGAIMQYSKSFQRKHFSTNYWCHTIIFGATMHKNMSILFNLLPQRSEIIRKQSERF